MCLGWAAAFAAAAGLTSVRAAISGDVAADRAPRRLVVWQVPVAAEASAALASRTNRVIGGSRVVVVDLEGPARVVRDLTSGLSAVGRPDVSYDGKRVLFVGRSGTTDPLAIWECEVDGGASRKLFEVPRSTGAVLYYPRVFTLDDHDPPARLAFSSLDALTSQSQFFTAAWDGSAVEQITFAPGGVFDPAVLSDGRLLFRGPMSHNESTSGVPGPSRASLFTVRLDGTDLALFTQPEEPAAIPGSPSETSDGIVVLVERDIASGDGGGSLVAVRRARSLHSGRVIAGKGEGWYQTPRPWRPGELLVSRRSTGEKSYGIHTFDIVTGGPVMKLWDDPEWHDLGAIAAEPRPEPSGCSSVVNRRTAVGQLYALNVHLSDEHDGPPISVGTVRSVRIFSAGSHEAQPGNPPLGVREEPSGAAVLLGEAPVETDGSFFLELPAKTPLRFELVDESGTVVRAMQSWTWVMPAERRGCIGCHEDRELAPPNRHVLALRKAPHRLGIADPNLPGPELEGAAPEREAP